MQNLTPTAEGQPLETAILFVDLVSSSEFSSILSLQQYADYVDTFEALCKSQCEYFFTVFHNRDYLPVRDYKLEIQGDELAVFLHTGNQSDDVYQLACLAITLKCAWLCCPMNIQRINQGAPSVELAIGIHAGLVWAKARCEEFCLRGFAINVAKRVETASREGEHFRIFISGAAFKRVNRRIRHLLIGPKRLLAMKGIGVPVSVHEVIDSFVDPSARLDPQTIDRFRQVAKRAMQSNSFDMWIHTCFQLVEGVRNGCVCDECMELCRNVLNIQPDNGVALYYASQASVERSDFATAILYLQDLTRLWPTFTDGWLELGRAQKKTGALKAATRSILQARRQGAGVGEEALPETV